MWKEIVVAYFEVLSK